MIASRSPGSKGSSRCASAARSSAPPPGDDDPREKNVASVVSETTTKSPAVWLVRQRPRDHRRRRLVGGRRSPACSRSRFDRVRLWVQEPDLAARMERTRVNDIFLPGISIPAKCWPGIRSRRSRGADVVLSVMPSHVVRESISDAALAEAFDADRERDQRSRIRNAAADVAGDPVGRRAGVPDRHALRADVRAGSRRRESHGSRDRVRGPGSRARKSRRVSPGPRSGPMEAATRSGVEIGGALKNVIAIGAGISDGLGSGTTRSRL